MVHDLVGRETELAEARDLLQGPVRLLTLTGPPGVGKTRLANAVMAAVAPGLADGAVFADLTPARDRHGALGEIARVVGVSADVGRRTGQRVHHALLERELLLVLDNAEQVVGLADELTSILQDCPRVRLLVTSRERMHLSEERELPVEPLALPVVDAATTAEIESAPSVAMFATAARAAWPGFRVTDGNAAAVAEICVRLDGLPLALILAAARVRMFSPADIAARIRDRTAILRATSRDVPERHRSLRAAISWSEAVLGADERRLFRRLSVFEGAWTLRAAEGVTAEPGQDVARTLESLVDKSLVQRVAAPGAEATFALLASLREYAAEQLEACDEAALLAERHAAYCIDVARRVETSIGTAREGVYWSWTTRHEGDLTRSLSRCLATGRHEGALVLATALGWTWYTRGHLGEADKVLDRVLTAADGAEVADDNDVPDVPDDSDVPDGVGRLHPEVLAAARIIAGVIAWGRDDLERADALLEPARADCARRDDARRLAMACAFLGHVARDSGRLDDARSRHEEAAHLFDGVGSARGAAWARFDLGRVAWRRGDLDAAGELFRVALRGFRDDGYRWAVAWCAWALGNVDVEVGHPDDGAGLLLLALTEFDATSDLRGVASACEALAVVATARDRHADAMQLVGVATGLRLRIDVPLTADDAARVDRVDGAARRSLGDYVADRERESGRRLSVAAAIHVAQRLITPAAGPSAGPDITQLTPREREVVRLVAQGCTNQQIGRRLDITPRTAETHLHHIMGKLDVRSRSEVAVWATRHSLSTASPA